MVPVVPIEAGHLVREETPDMESTGGVLTFAWPPPLSDQEVVETQVLKFIKTWVGSIRRKIDIFVRRVGMREVIPSRGEMIPVVKGCPHDKRARGSDRVVGVVLSRHDDDRGCQWFSCIAGRVAR